MCQVCICCPAPSDCPVPQIHEPITTSDTPLKNTPSRCIASPYEGSGMALRPRKPLAANDKSMYLYDSDMSDAISTSKRAALKKVYRLLSISTDSLDIVPWDGIAISDNNRSLQKAGSIVTTVRDAVSRLVLQKEEDMDQLTEYAKEQQRKGSAEEKNKALLRQLVQLSFFGNANTVALSQSILAASMEREPLHQLIRDEYDQLEEEQQEKIKPDQLIIGRQRYSNLQTSYEEFLQGAYLSKLPKPGCTMRPSFPFRMM
jgi:hypothetical protein